MRSALWSVALGLAVAVAASAASCPLPAAGQTANLSSCSVTSTDGLFNWNLTGLQVSLSNPNITPNAGAVSLSASVSTNATQDVLSITEQINPLKWSAPSNSSFLFFAVNYNLSVTPNYTSSTSSTTPTVVESEEYLNGVLFAKITNTGITTGPQDPGLLTPSSVVYIQDLAVLNLATSPTLTFTTTFDISTAGLHPITTPPSSVPEPASIAFMGLGAICVSGLCRLRRK